MSALFRGFAQLQQIVIASNNDRSSAPTHQALLFPSRKQLVHGPNCRRGHLRYLFLFNFDLKLGIHLVAADLVQQSKQRMSHARRDCRRGHLTESVFELTDSPFRQSAVGFAAELGIALPQLRRLAYPRLTFCSLDLLVRSKNVRPRGPEQSRQLTLRAVRVEG